MSPHPQPLFETFDRFHELNFLHLNGELPAVRNFLQGCTDELQAVEGYRAVRGFLKSYAGNEATFNSYRTHIERLLLWSLLVAGKPLVELRRRDAEAFMEFCLNPPADWIGLVVKSRFLRVGGRKKLDTDTYTVNLQWRPFSHTVAKRERKIAEEAVAALPSRPYRMSQGSVAQVFAVCGSFFQHAIDEGLTEVNPFRAVKQKSIYKQRNTLDDAPYRDMKDLQADLRHNSLSTTQNTYYNTLDEQRAHSVKSLPVRR